MKTWHAAIVAAATVVVLFRDAAADDPAPAPRRSYVAARADIPPKVDGLLDDACWKAVEWATDFTQREPDENKPPTEQTAFKIVYDDRALYLAYRAYEHSPADIMNLLSRRDRFPGDWIEVNIDSYHDHRTAFSFTSSVSGTRGDEYISNDGDNWDGSWDPIWRLRTHVDAEGWTAEVEIPLSQLRFTNAEEQTWGLQVTRRINRKEERSVWQPISKSESGWVSRFGELRGIRGVHARRPVELLPYTLGKTESYEAVPGDPFLDGRNGDASFGVDGKVALTSNMTVDFTVNPDFGQVEADPSEVNLTAFETRFQEKRPFFIEGNDILSLQLAPAITGGSFTDDNLFYSRRIGPPPHGDPTLADGEYADVPAATSIIAAAKLTGHTTNGLSVGVLESMTAKEQAQIASAGSPTRAEAVEPLSNFIVGRAVQDIHQGNTRIGAMVTALNRHIDDPALDELLRSDAYVGGGDLLHQWHNRTWYVAATGALSTVRGSASALLATQTSSAHYFQRPDNDYQSLDSTRTSLSGSAGSLRFGKQGGKHIRFETGGAWRTPGFEINDVGFMRIADEVDHFTWAGYSIRNPFAIFRRFQINFNENLSWDFGGTRLQMRGNSNFNTNFKNNWATGASVTRQAESVSNSALRGGPSSAWPGWWNANGWVDTDYRKRFAMSFGGGTTVGDESSLHSGNAWVDGTIRVSPAMQVTLSPSYSRNRDAFQYIETKSVGGLDRYIMGHIDQKTAALTIRFDYTVRPNLTIQYYGAPFVSAGSYADLKNIDSPRAAELSDRYQLLATTRDADGNFLVDEDGNGSTDYTVGNPDFNVRDFNSNLVVRWEFQAGSVAYLVWSQARSDVVPTGDFELHNDVTQLFDQYPHNVFLIKVSKWFSL